MRSVVGTLNANTPTLVIAYKMKEVGWYSPAKGAILGTILGESQATRKTNTHVMTAAGILHVSTPTKIVTLVIANNNGRNVCCSTAAKSAGMSDSGY